MKDGTTYTCKQYTSKRMFSGALGLAFLHLLLSITVLGAWVSVAEAQLRRCLILYLLVSAAWLPPVGAQPALVKDINLLPSGSSPREFVAIGNVVYFAASNGVTGRELWHSDGTAAGTVLVKDI